MKNQSKAEEKKGTPDQQKQAFKEGAMDNTGKLPGAAPEPETIKKETPQNVTAARSPDKAS